MNYEKIIEIKSDPSHSLSTITNQQTDGTITTQSHSQITSPIPAPFLPLYSASSLYSLSPPTYSLISQGAEARLYQSYFGGVPCCVKERFRKSYRHPLLDQKLTTQRLYAEARCLNKVRSAGIDAPVVYLIDPYTRTIWMEWLQGETVKIALSNQKVTPTIANSTVSHEEKKDEEDKDFVDEIGRVGQGVSKRVKSSFVNNSVEDETISPNMILLADLMGIALAKMHSAKSELR